MNTKPCKVEPFLINFKLFFTPVCIKKLLIIYNNLYAIVISKTDQQYKPYKEYPALPYPTCTTPIKSIWANFLTFCTEVGSGSSGAWDAGNGINAEEPKDVWVREPIPFWLGFKLCVVDNNCSLGFANWSGVNKDGVVGKRPEVESTNEGAECRGWIALGSGQMSW